MQSLSHWGMHPAPRRCFIVVAGTISPAAAREYEAVGGKVGSILSFEGRDLPMPIFGGLDDDEA